MIKSTKIKDATSRPERDLINLSTGKKKPRTEKEQKMFAEIRHIKEKSGVVYIPHD